VYVSQAAANQRLHS